MPLKAKIVISSNDNDNSKQFLEEEYRSMPVLKVSGTLKNGVEVKFKGIFIFLTWISFNYLKLYLSLYNGIY